MVRPGLDPESSDVKVITLPIEYAKHSVSRLPWISRSRYPGVVPSLGSNYIEALGLSQLPVISASPKDSVVGAAQGRTFRGELSRNDYVCHHCGKTSIMPQLQGRSLTNQSGPPSLPEGSSCQFLVLGSSLSLFCMGGVRPLWVGFFGCWIRMMVTFLLHCNSGKALCFFEPQFPHC